MEELHQACPDRIIPAFGVHPYFAHQVSPHWFDDLRKILIANPKAIVGEIGLDKVARTPETGKCEFDSQIEVSFFPFLYLGEQVCDSN